MLREKLAEDIAEKAAIKTDLKYEQDKSDPKDDYMNARKLLMSDSLWESVDVDQAEQTRKAIKDSVASGGKIQSETPTISYHTDPKQDYLIRATRDFAQPYLQQKYDDYTKERGLPKTKVYAKPNYESKYDSVATAFGRYPLSYVEHYVDENKLSTIMKDIGLNPQALGRVDRSILRRMDDTIGHEVAHVDPNNPYSRSFMDNFNTNLRLALGAPNQVSKNILLDEQFGESSDRGGRKNYFALPGRSLDELRSTYYGYLNRIKKHPMSIVSNPLPEMYYPKLIAKPIINAARGVINSENDSDRALQREKMKYYIRRALYPHLGDPTDISN